MLKILMLKMCQLVKLVHAKFTVLLYLLKIIKDILTPKFYINNFINQVIFVGFYSLPIIGMTAIFSGAVMALQSYIGFARFAAENTIPKVVSLSLTRELAPVLTGLMVTARVGASFAAELATMRVTEQIDALYTLSTNPIKYLIAPRVLASVISLPILVIVADIIGIMGGYLVGVFKLSFNSANYITNTVKYLQFADINSGLIKAFVFGIIISSTSCYFGYTASKGAKGVGIASTNAVVGSSILILFSNYLITEFLFSSI
jgi:phospholipid/cholesterol/gamma-HCH transport system permease protein